MGTRRQLQQGRGLLGLWLVMALGGGSPALALEPQRRLSQYNHASWQSESGLPQNSVLAITQSPEGYLWFGTYEGLARFDGVRFSVLDRRTTPELREHSIHALEEGAPGVMWVGTASGVLLYEQGEFRRPREAGEALTEALIHGLAADGRFMWLLAGRKGLVRMPLSGQGPPRFFSPREGMPEAGLLKALIRSRAGGVWVGTTQGLLRVEGDTVRAVPFPEGMDPFVRSLLEARDGTLWIGTNSGLASLREGRFTLYGQAQGGLREKVLSLLEDRDGNLWVGTSSGLLRRNAAGFAPVTTPRKLASNPVISLFEDRDGSLWVGTTRDGVHRLSNGPFIPWGEPEGSSLDSIHMVLEGRDGTLWVAAMMGKLERVKDGIITRMGPEHGLEDERLAALAEGPDGTIWAGTVSGAYRLEGERFVRVGAEQGVPPGHVMAIAPDSSGGVWLATAEGLVSLRDGRASVYGKEQGFVPQHIMVLLHEDAGTLWYGTHSGLVRFSEGSFTHYTTRDGLAGDVVMSLYVDSRGALWVGTTTGLSRLKDGRFARITSAQGLPDDTIYTLLLDEEDHFWMSSNKGVVRVSKRELEEVADGRRERVRATFFDERDGMRVSECNGGRPPAGWRTRDGRMWFANLRGAVMVDPRDARIQPPTPRVRIEELRVQGRPVPLSERVELPPGQTDLRFRFTAFEPRSTARLPFRYRLEGIDKDWVDAESRRLASYTRLPPGTYRFQVTTQDRAGEWLEPGAVLEVELKPWFHQTVWFYLLCALAVVGGAASTYAWRVGRLKERERWLQARVEERTQELARANQELDAHLRTLRATQAQLVQAGKMAAVGTLAAGVGHEINNPLSYIVSNLEHASEEAASLERQGEGSEQSRERLREMQQVLREAMMGADRVRRIVRDLKTFSRQDEDTRGPVDLRAVMDSAAKMAAGELRPRGHLARDYAADVPLVEGNEPRLAQVFLNLLINAAHALPEGQAERNEVRLVLRRGEPGQVVAEVRDTGSGMPPEVLGRIFDPFFTTKPVGVGTGLGLALCHAFITAMGGRIEVESEAGRGTVFRLTLPAASSAVARAPRPEQAGAGPTARGRVLIVDDDPLVSSALRRTLAREHEVEVVVSSRRALELLTSPQGSYDVILCDLMMPEMTGMELHAHLEAEAPERARRMVFITGGAYTPAARTFLERVSNPRVEKPFEPEVLRGQVREWVRKVRAPTREQAA